MKKKGIDISYHQRTVDFNKVKNDGVEFVIFRDGYGKTTDQKFFEYVQKVNAVDLPILAVYHFSYALNEQGSVEEARFCIENMKKAGIGPEVMVMFDFEYDTVTYASKNGIKLTKKECKAHTIAFCEEVKKLGYTPGVYMNLDYHKNWYTQDVIDKYPVWLADYTGNPDFPCIIQQYTNKGRVNGINGNVDMNYYFGNITANLPEKELKDDETLANEVINGLWGNGEFRKQNLTKAGYNYKKIQTKVNEILNGKATKTDKPVQSQVQNVTKVIKASENAKMYNNGISGNYITTGNLYCRNGAGTNKVALCVIPKGTNVICTGEYSEYNGTKWLYIQFIIDGIQYIGFSSGAYLKKIS